MLKHSALTFAYTACVTGLLMFIFPKFRSDMDLIWYNLNNGSGLDFGMNWLNSGNFFPVFLGVCGLGCGFLMWWHDRPN